MDMGMGTTARSEYPMAGSSIGNLRVSNEIPNLSSISATLNEWEELPGIRKVPMKDFDFTSLHDLYYSKSDFDRVRELAKEIERNEYIDPLIVVIDCEGLYVLEGGHRLGALFILKKKAIPALIVLDTESLESTIPTIPTIPTISAIPTNLRRLAHLVLSNWSQFKKHFNVRNPLFHATSGPRAAQIATNGFRSDAESNYGLGNVVGISFSRSLEYLMQGHFGNLIFIVDRDELDHKYKIQHIDTYSDEREERVMTKKIPAKSIKGLIINSNTPKKLVPDFPFPIVYRYRNGWGVK